MDSASRKEIKEASLYKTMKAYWRIFHSNNYYRYEILEYLKKIIRRRWPKNYLPLKIWLFGVEKKKIRFNPRAYKDTETFFEQLLMWKNYKMQKYLIKYAQLAVKAKRHQKICERRKSLRL